MSKGILVFGANSAIATACLRLWAAQGHRLFLVARDRDRLERLAADLRVRGAGSVSVAASDLSDLGSHRALVDQAISALGHLDACLIAHGVLGDQGQIQAEPGQLVELFQSNCLSAMSLLELVGAHMESRRCGTLAAISSVAGDRGRASNYAYGSSKAALSTYLQGLRNRLYRSGVRVMTIKPGFVDTPMTASFKKGLLWSTPEAVAAKVCAAIDAGRKDVLYVPGFWRLIMGVICALPESLFKRTKL